jgi:nitrite reductase/ring-hydroxylating ferredoxin subunit
MKKTYFFIIVLIFFSCRKANNRDSWIPYVYVDIAINVNEPAYFNLSAIGGWEYLSGGSRGLLVYRKSNDEFLVYDRHCPYQPSDECGRIEVDNTNISAIDSCCMSRFLLTDGSVTEGKAEFPLAMYNTTFDGAVLYIYN